LAAALRKSVRAIAFDPWRQRTDPDEFLTVAEVAELLKMNPQTVRNWTSGLCGLGSVEDVCAR
jgi:hypothetical protein